MARSKEPVLPEAAEKTEAVRTMFDAIAPRYEMVNRVMTFGLDGRWRKRSVAALGLPVGSVVLDVACGTGDLSRTAAHKGLRPIGADLSFGMLGSSHGTGPLVQADASQMPFGSATVDGLLCGYALRNFTDLEASLREMARVLKPGGRLSILEVAEPTNALLRMGHRFWFTKAVPVIGGLLSDRSAYRYLPASTVYLPSAEELRRILVAVGFSGVNHQLLSGGVSQLFSATRSAAN
ncbi:MAG: ubiquinone/menaquinone biosynthesis methyltransferase [Actinomycetes bacterium]